MNWIRRLPIAEQYNRGFGTASSREVLKETWRFMSLNTLASNSICFGFLGVKDNFCPFYKVADTLSLALYSCFTPAKRENARVHSYT